MEKLTLAWSHRAALAALLLLFPVAAGCSVDRRTGAYACTPDGECPQGRQCIDGWCVAVDVEPDAGEDPDVDAAVDPCDNPVCGDGTCCLIAGEGTCSCPDDCGSFCGDDCCNGEETEQNCPADCGASCSDCTKGACSDGCAAVPGDCTLECTGGCSCDLSCNTADACDARCRNQSTCTVSCDDADECDVRCESNSVCTIDCRDEADCGKIECIGGSACLIYCGGPICDFDQCSGGSGIMSCPDDIVVCNRLCP